MSTDIKYSITAQDRFSQTFAALKRDLGAAQTAALGVGAAVSRLGGLVGLGAGAGLGGMALAVRQLANDLDSLNDSADATGSTIEKLSGLEDVARRNGGTLDLVTTALVKMNQALASAKPDSGISVALKAIGLDAAKLREQDPSDALLDIAKALAQFENDGNKARLVQELFGKSLREVAPLLGDLAAAGTINAKVTAEQAAEAEKFNKALAALATNASNAGRSLVSDLLPKLNEVFSRVDAAKSVFGGLGAGLLAQLKTGSAGFADAGEGAAFYAAKVRQLEGDIGRLKRGGSIFDRLNAESATKDLDDARKLLQFYERVAVQTGKFAGGGRGFVNPGDDAPKPKLPDLTNATGTKPAQSEAEKYLESLQKQGEATRELTAYEKVLNDLRANRIEGVGVKVTREQLLYAAQLADSAARMKFEEQTLVELGKERVRQAEKLEQVERELGASKQRAIDEIAAMAAETQSGQIERLNAQIDTVQDLLSSGTLDPSRVGAYVDVLDKLKLKLREVAGEPIPVFEKLEKVIQQSMSRSADALLDFAIDGRGSLLDVGRQFAKDIARGMLNEPLQKEMQQLGKSISDALKSALDGKDIFADVIKWLKSLDFSGGGSGGGGIWSGLASAVGGFFGGTTTRAMGGPVKAGQLVRWQENGREWFVPDENGTVVTDAQRRRAAGGGSAPVVNNVFHVNGDVSSQTVALMEAMIDRSNARLMRNLRTQGAG